MYVLAADVPSITDWMQGWGNVLGVLMSTIAVIFTGLLLRHERRIRREEKADADAAQARLVLGRITDYGGVQIDRETGATLSELRVLSWEVRNHSQMPIYHLGVWIVRFSMEHMRHEEYHFDEYHPDFAWWVMDDRVGGEILLPYPIPAGEVVYNFDVICSFTDNAGLDWRRNGWAPPARRKNGSREAVKPKQPWTVRLRETARRSRWVKSRHPRLVEIEQLEEDFEQYTVPFRTTGTPSDDAPFPAASGRNDDIPF